MTTDLPGLPVLAVREWLRGALPGAVPEGPWQPQVISGGLSNLTYRLPAEPGDLILRRPPVGPLLPRAHDMEREYRVLTALGPTPVPVPEALAFCPDPAVIGAPFYVMRAANGVVLREPTDSRALTIEERTAVTHRLVDALADLHAVDPDSVGLGDFGRRSGYAARQLRTWGQQWQRSRTRDLPDMDRLLDRLTGAQPAEGETTLVHGDYRLDNTVIDLTGRPRIAAILDWELSTLGDPIADLALLLTYWHDRGDTERSRISVAAGLTAMEGFPTTGELAQRYAARTGRCLDTLPFYRALSAMKLAVILEGVHARHLSGQASGAGYGTTAAAVPLLAARALALLRRVS